MRSLKKLEAQGKRVYLINGKRLRRK